MSALLSSPWPAVYLTVWVVLVAFLLLANHRAHVKPEPVNRITELPPVPQSDAHWLDAWPSGAHLIDFDAVHGLLSEEQVFPTADDAEAEAAVYNKLCAEIDANFRVLGDAA